MFNVYFYENKHLLLSQLLKRVPSVGENVTIKGRKGKIDDVRNVDEMNFHVYVTLEKALKMKHLAEDTKKKKK
ncbi:hypothetical protein ACFSCX_12805 [Bacillus salitolerans]|uniref:Preprotein translocase subunit SecA n=1 Tax=Bacillus salitolerans TaxID=1437434 RepID=A0ABW4LQI0_9BACI